MCVWRGGGGGRRVSRGEGYFFNLFKLRQKWVAKVVGLFVVCLIRPLNGAVKL